MKKEKDSASSYIGQKDRLGIARKEQSDESMGDLHLKRYGLSRKSSNRFRRNLKRQSSRLRRRHGKKIARDFYSN